MKIRNLFWIMLLPLLLAGCKKEVIPSGDLFITTRYDGMAEDNVEVWVYESWQQFQDYEYLMSGFTNDYGEITFTDLEPGRYYLEAEKEKSSLFVLSKVDSVEIIDGRQTNKILNLEAPAK